MSSRFYSFPCNLNFFSKKWLIFVWYYSVNLDDCILHYFRRVDDIMVTFLLRRYFLSIEAKEECLSFIKNDDYINGIEYTGRGWTNIRSAYYIINWRINGCFVLYFLYEVWFNELGNWKEPTIKTFHIHQIYIRELHAILKENWMYAFIHRRRAVAWMWLLSPGETTYESWYNYFSPHILKYSS